ncbi:hypothetical protein C9192_24310 [Escherichia coli]|nr:hypothetical protein C9192_24310 [Escherichia coli]
MFYTAISLIIYFFNENEHKTKTYNAWQLYALMIGCMFDDKKLAQEDKKSPCANALSQVTNHI